MREEEEVEEKWVRRSRGERRGGIERGKHDGICGGCISLRNKKRRRAAGMEDERDRGEKGK